MLAVLALAGCYSPRAPFGAPCNAGAPACPAGQACVRQDNGTFCDVPPDAAGDAPPIEDAAIDTSTDARTAFVYTPSVVACINPKATPPDPAACATAAGPNSVRVDAQDGTTVFHPWDTFVRVDLDGAFAGKTVTGVQLEMTVSTSTSSDSTSSGVVYQATAFTLADLSVAEPAKASATALAPTQGAVVQLQTVDWPLPASLAAPNGSVYLELETPSANAVMYWDLAGTTPPRLVVDVQ
jgi:hypothetical protein